MNDILDLPGWAVLSKRLDAGEYEIEAEYTVLPTACQKCGVIGRLYKHGTKNTTYRDSPIRGHAVRLLARVQRYKCRECGETFLQPLDGMQDSRLMTKRCAEFIQRQCLIDTFLRISENVGCDEKTVRALAGERIEGEADAYRPELPAWLGIDETFIAGELRMTLTDIQFKKPVDMLPNDSNGTLATWLNRFKDRSHVQVVSTDMHKAYRLVVREMLPGVPVVVDKFHVVRMANTALDEVRNRVAKDNPAPVGREWKRQKGLLRMRNHRLSEKGKFNLDMWLDNEPELGIAYRLKESFYDIYEAPTKDDARRLLAEWRAAIPAHMRNTVNREYRKLWTATKNWTEDILSYWDFPVTNGYTEAMNGVAKTLNRAGKGYSFDVLRARWLFQKKRSEKPRPVDAPSLREIVQARYRSFPVDRVSWHRLRREALAANPDGICSSCRGVFDPKELELHRALPMVPGEHIKYMLVCKPCHHRFHIAEVTPGHEPTL